MTLLQYNNIRPNLAGDYPQIDPTALIDPSAQIIGNVKIDRDVFVGPLPNWLQYLPLPGCLRVLLSVIAMKYWHFD